MLASRAMGFRSRVAGTSPLRPDWRESQGRHFEPDGTGKVVVSDNAFNRPDSKEGFIPKN
jgi:hypothetical protein